MIGQHVAPIAGSARRDRSLRPVQGNWMVCPASRVDLDMIENTTPEAGKAMNDGNKCVWAIYLVGFQDDPTHNEASIEPYIGKECVPVTAGRPEQAWYDVRLAVLARGGHLLTIAATADEAEAEQIRQSAEAAILKPK